MPSREWYTNGDYLVLLVSFIIILPLSLLRNLGKCRFGAQREVGGVKNSAATQKQELTV